MTDAAGDERRLADLGVAQVFKRELSLYTNFCVTFQVMCVPGTITSCLGLAWNLGGPAACTHGWLVSTAASWVLGLSMAEITSALPTCGGPFYWASVLAREHGKLVGWITGWFSFMGEIALVGAAAASLVSLIASLLQVNHGYLLSPVQQLGLYGACLVVAAIINSLPGRVLALVSAWGFFFMFTGVLIVALGLPSIAPWRQGAHFLFLEFWGHQYSTTGISSNAYMFLLNTQVAQYCVIGWDACCHLSEETVGAQKSVPYAIILSVVASAVLGYIFMIALLLSVQDPAQLLTGNADGFVGAQIFFDAFRARYGDGRMGTILMVALPGSAVFLALIADILSGSRMVYSFARSGGIPCSGIFATVNSRTHTPLRAVWLLTVLAFLLGLPLLKSAAAFGAVTSMANIALLISYAIPIACRHTFSRHSFEAGPFHLGSWSEVIGWSSVAWTALSSALFLLPTQYPVNVQTLNYAPIILGVLLGGCLLGWYCPRIGGKVWYRGPDMPTRASNNAELVERQKRLKAVQQQVLNRRPRPRDLKAYQVQHDMTPARFDAVRRRENPLFKE